MLRITAMLTIFMTSILFSSQAPCKETASTKEPIHITSNQMTALDKEGKVIFTGNVKAQKGDLTIYADELIVFYEGAGKTTKNRGHDLKRLMAKGNVRIIKGAKSAKGDRAVYDKTREVIVLTGDAKVWEGKNSVSGAKITVFLNEDKSIVESKPGERVKAMVYTDSK